MNKVSNRYIFSEVTKRCTCKLPRASRDLKSVEKFWLPILIETFHVSFFMCYKDNISNLGNLPDMTNWGKKK